MQFRWIIALTLWTIIAGPIFVRVPLRAHRPESTPPLPPRSIVDTHRPAQTPVAQRIERNACGNWMLASSSPADR